MKFARAIFNLIVAEVVLSNDACRRAEEDKENAGYYHSFCEGIRSSICELVLSFRKSFTDEDIKRIVVTKERYQFFIAVEEEINKRIASGELIQYDITKRIPTNEAN